MGTALRWALIPVASIVAWHIALLCGITLLSIAETFCPADEMISGSCVAPWFQAVESIIFCASTALSATFVVAAAFLVAPTQRVLIAWLAFTIGSIVAFFFALGTSAWGMFISAVIAGLFTALVLSKFPMRKAAKVKIDEAGVA
jgi:hypothetical protein